MSGVATVPMGYLLDLLRVIDPEQPTPVEQERMGVFSALYAFAIDKLAAYQESPGCGTCRAELSEVFENDLNRANELLRRLDPSQDWRIVGQGASTQTQPRRDVAGSVIELDGSDEAYMNLIKDAARLHWRYRGLSVCPSPNGVKVYFY